MEIVIDDIVPCLKRLSDEAIVETIFEQIIPKNSDLKDWLFDWSKESAKGFEVYALKVKDNDAIQGLVSMAAHDESSCIWLNLAEAAPHNNKINPAFTGQQQYSGIGAHLTAQGVYRSLELGYNGVVAFDAKTNLIEHYIKTLGAVQIGHTTRMYIPENAARRLYENYFG